jgi:undecaprenyl pyrophosphate phosphatase UppP
VVSLDQLAAVDLWLPAVGLASAFATLLLVISWLLQYVASRDSRPFGYYRIVAGLAVLARGLFVA